MEYTKDSTRQNKIIKRYHSRFNVKWLPCTYVNNYDIVCAGNINYPEPYSGRWAVYERYWNFELKKYDDKLIYIAETKNHNYRDIHENIDCVKLYERDLLKKQFYNPLNFNPSKYVEDNNTELENKRNKELTALDREKANDMYKYVTKEPTITAGMSFK